MRPLPLRRGGHAWGQDRGQVVSIAATEREAKFKGTDGEEKARSPAHQGKEKLGFGWEGRKYDIVVQENGNVHRAGKGCAVAAALGTSAQVVMAVWMHML